MSLLASYNFEALGRPGESIPASTTIYDMSGNGNDLGILDNDMPLVGGQSGAAVNGESASTTSVTITLPTVQTGYVAVVSISASSTVVTAPSGWTLVNSVFNSSAPILSAVYYRVLSAADSGASFSWTGMTAGRAAGLWEIYDGVDTTNPIDCPSQTAQTNTANSITAPTITTVTTTALIIHAVTLNAGASADLIVPSPMLEVNNTTGTGRRHKVAYEEQYTPGASATRVWTHTTTNLQYCIVVFALRKAVAGNSISLVSNGIASTGSTRARTYSPTVIKPTTAVTWMGWVKLTGNTYTSGQLFGRCNDDSSWGETFSFYLDGTNAASYRFLTVIQTNSTSLQFSSAAESLTGQTWAHIAASWSATDPNLRVYINGSLVASAPVAGNSLYYGPANSTSRYFNILYNEQQAQYGSQAVLDDIRIFDNQLSGSEIMTYMATPVVATPSSGNYIPFVWIAGINGP